MQNRSCPINPSAPRRKQKMGRERTHLKCIFICKEEKRYRKEKGKDKFQGDHHKAGKRCVWIEVYREIKSRACGRWKEEVRELI